MFVFTGEAGELIYPSRPPRSLTIACLLSLLLIGVGQIYLGQIVKGVALLFFTACFGLMVSMAGIVALWGIGILDSFLIGKKLGQGQPVRRWEWF
jgi:hypothetical protein